MKEFWNTIQLIFAAVGGWLGYFLGGCDGLLIALIIFFYIYPAAVKKRFTVWMAQWSSRYTYSGTYHPRERSAASAGTSTWTSTSQAQ